MLAVLLSEFWLKFVVYQWLKEELDVSFLNNLIYGSIGNWTVIKVDIMC